MTWYVTVASYKAKLNIDISYACTMLRFIVVHEQLGIVELPILTQEMTMNLHSDSKPSKEKVWKEAQTSIGDVKTDPRKCQACFQFRKLSEILWNPDTKLIVVAYRKKTKKQLQAVSRKCNNVQRNNFTGFDGINKADSYFYIDYLLFAF